jgi:membrane protease YdiL (CAAX protease family)
MSPLWFDHVLVLCFAVLLPIRGATVGYRRLAALPENATRTRQRFYVQSLGLHAFIIVLTVTVWLLAGREWEALGLGIPQPDAFLAGLAAAFAGTALHWLQGHASRRLSRRRHRVPDIERLGRLNPLMPRTRRELDAFIALLLVAACSEEILFRGYLTAYLASYVPFAVAATVSVLVFGAGHLYQGAKGVVQTLIIGAVCMVFYVTTESLWPGIVLHGGLNFVSAHMGYAIVRSARAMRPPT